MLPEILAKLDLENNLDKLALGVDVRSTRFFFQAEDGIRDRSVSRGLGLLIGCVLNAEFAGKAKLISQEAAVAGVMVLIAGANVVRFAPALNVSEEEVATGLDRFALACERIKAGGSS